VPLLRSRRRGLLPQPPGLTESILLVVIVVRRWETLDRPLREQRLREPIPVLHAAETEARGVENVRARDAHLREMRRRSEVLLVRLVEKRGEDVGIEHRVAAAQNLDAGRAFLRHPLHELARLLGRIDAAAVPHLLAREDERHDTRRDDLVLRAAIALVKA